MDTGGPDAIDSAAYRDEIHPVIWRIGSSLDDKETIYRNNLADGTGSFTEDRVATDLQGVFMYAEHARDTSGSPGIQSGVAAVHREYAGDIETYSTMRLHGNSFALTHSDLSSAVDLDNFNFAIKREFGTNLRCFVVRTEGNDLVIRRSNDRCVSAGSEYNIRIADDADDDISYVSFQPIAGTGGRHAIYYLYTRVNGATVTYEWTVSRSTTHQGYSCCWVHTILDTADSPYTFFDRIGVIGKDAEDYLFIVRASESSPEDTLEVYMNTAQDASGTWSLVNTIGPVPSCPYPSVDYDRTIVTDACDTGEARPAVLLYCSNGVIVYAMAANASAASDWNMEVVALGAYPEHTAMSLYFSDTTSAPHIAYLTPTLTPGDYALQYIQTTNGWGGECFEHVTHTPSPSPSPSPVPPSPSPFPSPSPVISPSPSPSPSPIISPSPSPSPSLSPSPIISPSPSPSPSPVWFFLSNYYIVVFNLSTIYIYNILLHILMYHKKPTLECTAI